VNNPVLLRVDLEDEDQPLSDVPLVATFTLTASHLNSGDAILVAEGLKVIPIPPGGQYRFERVDLSRIMVRGQGEETAVFVVGQAG
jgi:hypothetical protein